MVGRLENQGADRNVGSKHSSLLEVTWEKDLIKNLTEGYLP